MQKTICSTLCKKFVQSALPILCITSTLLLSAGDAPKRSVIQELPRLFKPALQSHVSIPSYFFILPWGEERFEFFRNAFSSDGGKQWLLSILERGRLYLPYIYERIHFYGLPDELALLPVIESEYSPYAISKSGATGIWQFMRNSIKGYGMQIDDWVDERRDFMKSSEGALKKLRDNYLQFKNWELALAAYNSGTGAIKRAIEKASRLGEEKINYWTLRERGLLSTETSNYIPKFLALISILLYPGREGISLDWRVPQTWATINLDRPIDLALLAKESGVDLRVLQKYNPELRFGITPLETPYFLKVPANDVQKLLAVLENKDLTLIRYYLHTVRSGDTLTGLSKHYSTPLSMILRANPDLQASLILIGQKLIIPALKNKPTVEVPTKQDDTQDAMNRDFTAQHVVIKGDTLWNLSLQYNVQPEVLASKNNLRLDSILREGMILAVPIIEEVQ